MTIGIAIVIAMVLYLIDRNKVWKQAAKLVGGLILLAILGMAGIFGWLKYSSWQTERKEAKLDQERATFNDWYGSLQDCKRVMPSDAPSRKAFVFGKNFVVNGIDMLKMKRDIQAETDFVSPDDTTQGKLWDSMETVQPCKGVWAAALSVDMPAQPVAKTFSQHRGLSRERNYAWSTTAVTLTSQAVNEGMLVGKISANERVEVLEDYSYGVKVRTKNGVVGWVYPPSDLTKIAP